MLLLLLFLLLLLPLLHLPSPENRSQRLHQSCREIGFVQIAGITILPGAVFAIASEFGATCVASRGTATLPLAIGIVFVGIIIKASAQSATDGSAACLETEASNKSPNDPGA